MALRMCWSTWPSAPLLDHSQSPAARSGSAVLLQPNWSQHRHQITTICPLAAVPVCIQAAIQQDKVTTLEPELLQHIIAVCKCSPPLPTPAVIGPGCCAEADLPRTKSAGVHPVLRLLGGEELGWSCAAYIRMYQYLLLMICAVL